jgi:hypothetical protein
MNQEGRVRDNLKELLLVLRKGLIFLPKAPVHLRVKLPPVQLNKSPCSSLVNKVRPFSVLFCSFSPIIEF